MKKLLLTLVCFATFFAAKTQTLIYDFPFDNSLSPTVGTGTFSTNAGVSFVTDRFGNASGAININNTGTTATLTGLPYGGASRSVSLWVKLNVFNPNFNFLHTYGTSANPEGALIIINEAYNFLPNHPVTTTHNSTTQWVHYVFTYDGTASRIYVNGTLVGTQSLTKNTVNNSDLFRLGLSEAGDPGFFNGAIDDLKIYNGAISAQQVTNLFNAAPCATNTTPPANQSICPGTSTTISVSGSNVTWYSAAVGGTQLGTGNSFTTPIIFQATTYFAEVSGCSPRFGVTVNLTTLPSATITLSNDSIISNKRLLDSYVLKRDGNTVATGSSGGAFSFVTTTCGVYQAEFTNVTNSCPNRGASLTYNSGTCQHVVNIPNLATPARFSVGFGTNPGEPVTLMNGTSLNFIRCQSAVIIINVRDANGCLYNTQWFFGGGATSTTFTSSTDTLTNCTIYSNTITIGPNAPTNTTTTQNQTTCVGLSAFLTATGTGTLQWFNVPTGGTVLGTGSSFFTPSLNKDSIFYVQSLNGGCASARVAIPVTVLALPSTPTSNTPAANLTVCQGSGTTLSVTNPGAGFQVNWWNVPTGTASPNLLGSGTSINIPSGSLSSNATFYADVINLTTGCVSATRLAIQVTVAPVPTQPVLDMNPANLTICPGNSTVLNVAGIGTIEWYDEMSGGNLLATGTSYTTPALQTLTAYYAASKSGNCSSTRLQVVVQTGFVPVTPTNTTPTANLTRCAGQTTTLTATTGSANVTIRWYNVPTGGTSLQTGGTYNTPALSTTTTYYVALRSTLAGSCESARVPITITVNPAPTAAISPATVSICSGQSATLTASGGGTYAWSNSLGTNASVTIPLTTAVPSQDFTYTVTVTANGCSATATRIVTVNANPTAAITPGTVVICNGASATLTASGGTQYAWSDGGGSNVSATFSPTSTRSYTVTVTNAANCSATVSRQVTVNALPSAAINGPTTICNGLSATLTASGAGGSGSYLWSNNATTATITITPTQTTTYTVTVSTSANCTATATQTVSVQSAPTATISGATSVCAGSSTTLTANGGNTYAWANGLGANAAITVSPTSATTYTVTVSIGANCTATASQTVTVKQPTSSAQTQTICQGKTYVFNGQQLAQAGVYKDTLINAAGCDSVITLNLTVTPALQETINQTLCFGESLSFNGQTIAQSGAYIDTVQTAGGCDSIITLNVNVLNRIEQTINASICTGQSYNFGGQSLTQAGQYFDTLQTTLGCDSFIILNLAVNSFVTGSVNKAICQGETFTFNGQDLTQQGQYLDTLVSTGGCDSIVTLTLTVNSLPQPTITRSGFDLSTQAFANYQWQLNNSDINGAENQSYTATQNGNYTVIVTDANGCTNTSGVVNVTGVGIDNLSKFSLSIYPNPTNNFITIQTDATIETIEVYNLQGQKVLEAKSNTQLNMSEIAEGVYLVQVNTPAGTARRTILKQ